MKIFLSHSSANKEYGNALVELLCGIGLNDNKIIFTSNPAYGIPIGQNIYNWLKSQITEKPFVIYLLSKEYYSSIACLNEMGAAWVTENEHAMLFLPNFNLSSKEFQNGAIDPREIGFYINDEERLLSFIQHLEKYFSVTKNPVIINQKVKKYLKEIDDIKQAEKMSLSSISEDFNVTKKTIEPHSKNVVKEVISSPSRNTTSSESKHSEDLYSRFITSILEFNDEELILLHYICETGTTELMTGRQENLEIEKIKVWEESEKIGNILSKKYNAVIGKFKFRGYIEALDISTSDSSERIKLKPEIETQILDLPEKIKRLIKLTVQKNQKF